MLEAAGTRSPERGQATKLRFLDWFRDPVRCFVLVAVLVGGTMVWLVPPFGGTDEPAHFSRSYQITTGRFLPAESPDARAEFHGACIPDDLIHSVDVEVAHNLNNVGFPSPVGRLDRFVRCGDGKHFVTFSTFGSPIPYLPQAVTIGVARIFGADAITMDRAARIVSLLVYVLLLGVAIRRSPRGRWAFVGVGLLPVAMFQASTISHDGLTIAISLLVVSSALRVADPPVPRSTRSVLAEAAAFGLLLALCKPTYVVLALLYLLPLVGPSRRRELRPLALVVAGALVVSVLFNAAVENLWRTDADLFGIRVDPDAQKHALVHRPWDFVATSVRSIPKYAGDWVRGLVNVGDRVVDVTFYLVFLVAVGDRMR